MTYIICWEEACVFIFGCITTVKTLLYVIMHGCISSNSCLEIENRSKICLESKKRIDIGGKKKIVYVDIAKAKIRQDPASMRHSGSQDGGVLLQVGRQRSSRRRRAPQGVGGGAPARTWAAAAELLSAAALMQAQGRGGGRLLQAAAPWSRRYGGVTALLRAAGRSSA
jgi:hypothetical protein